MLTVPPITETTTRSYTLLVVAAVLINERKEILLTQRPEGKSLAGLWEFPGGKVEAHESPEIALVRELKEEIDITATPETLIPFSFASHDCGAFHLLMPLYILQQWQGTISGREGQAYHWVAAKDLERYSMPPADLPLVSQLQRFLGRSSPS